MMPSPYSNRTLASSHMDLSDALTDWLNQQREAGVALTEQQKSVFGVVLAKCRALEVAAKAAGCDVGGGDEEKLAWLI